MPNQGSAVVARFLFYDILSDYANDYGNCPEESIQLIDGNGNDVLGMHLLNEERKTFIAVSCIE